MRILVLVLDESVYICVGFGPECAYLHRFWMNMCIIALVLDDYVHTFVGC